MSYDDLTRAVRHEHALKQGLLARCYRLPIAASIAMDAKVEEMGAKELAMAVLTKLGLEPGLADPIVALTAWLDGRDSAERDSAGGRQARPFAGMGAGMDAGDSFIDRYINS
jgi:hypothetical protein